MRIYHLMIFALCTTLTWVGQERVAFADDSDSSTPPAIPTEEQLQVLTRGPVHEAFAQPVEIQAKTGLVVPTQPPADIKEIPQAQKPSGDNFVPQYIFSLHFAALQPFLMLT